MRLFIDGEWNGYRGELISMALVAEDGREFYAVLGCANPEPWVAEHVMPKLGVPPGFLQESAESVQVRLALFLAQFDAAHIVADWPEDIERFCRLLITGPGTRIDTPPLTIEIVRVDAPSKNPHNALADARGLRDSLAIARAADYLRAQADAQPVAWVDVADSYEGPYIFHGKEPLPAGRHDLYTLPAPAAPHPSAEDASRDAYEGCREDLLDWKRRALKAEREARNLAKALADTVNRPTFMGEPAAPQAEPKRELTADERDMMDSALRSSVKLVARGVAEPKREPKRDPLHGLAPTHRCPACGAFWRQCDDASWNLRSASCCGLCDAGRVELVCWLDEPKREPLSKQRIGELYRQWVKESGTTIADLMRAVERAHGIGGSDE